MAPNEAMLRLDRIALELQALRLRRRTLPRTPKGHKSDAGIPKIKALQAERATLHKQGHKQLTMRECDKYSAIIEWAEAHKYT